MLFPWPDWLPDILEYVFILFFIALAISFVSAVFERAPDRPYWKGVGQNLATSVIAFFAIGLVLFAKFLLNENMRFLLAPFGGFAVAFFFKRALLKRAGVETSVAKRLAWIHPVMMMAIPVVFIVYVVLLGSSWSN